MSFGFWQFRQFREGPCTLRSGPLRLNRASRRERKALGSLLNIASCCVASRLRSIRAFGQDGLRKQQHVKQIKLNQTTQVHPTSPAMMRVHVKLGCWTKQTTQSSCQNKKHWPRTATQASYTCWARLQDRAWLPCLRFPPRPPVLFHGKRRALFFLGPCHHVGGREDANYLENPLQNQDKRNRLTCTGGPGRPGI